MLEGDTVRTQSGCFYFVKSYILSYIVICSSDMVTICDQEGDLPDITVAGLEVGPSHLGIRKAGLKVGPSHLEILLHRHLRLMH